MLSANVFQPPKYAAINDVPISAPLLTAQPQRLNIKNYGIQRVVVDSLTQFESYPSASEQARVRFERVVNALRREGVSVMMTREAETRETETREAPFRVSPDLPYPFLSYPRQSSFG